MIVNGVLDSNLIDPVTGLPIVGVPNTDSGNVIIFKEPDTISTLNPNTDEWFLVASSGDSYDPVTGFHIDSGSMELRPVSTGDNADWEVGVVPSTVDITFNHTGVSSATLDVRIREGSSGTIHYQLLGETLPPQEETTFTIPAITGGENLDDLNWFFTINSGSPGADDTYVTDVEIVYTEAIGATDRIVARSGHYIRWTAPVLDLDTLALMYFNGSNGSTTFTDAVSERQRPGSANRAGRTVGSRNTAPACS